MHADDRAERPEDQSELNFEPASSQDPKRDRYVALAEKLLGYEPQTEPLYLPRMDYSNPDADADINPVSNIADLTDIDDQRLCIVCGVDDTSWSSMNIDRRIVRMEATIERRNRSGQTIDGEADPLSSRLAINLKSMSVELDGVAHECNSKQALRWVQVLASHPRQWISSTELESYDSELVEVRTDRLKNKLPDALNVLIETDRRKGSRLVLDG